MKKIYWNRYTTIDRQEPFWFWNLLLFSLELYSRQRLPKNNLFKITFIPSPCPLPSGEGSFGLALLLKNTSEFRRGAVLAKHAELTRYWCPDKRNILKYYNLWALEYQLSFLWENLFRKWGWFLKTKYWLGKTVDNFENWKLTPRILGAGRRGRRPLRQDNLKLITIYLHYKW